MASLSAALLALTQVTNNLSSNFDCNSTYSEAIIFYTEALIALAQKASQPHVTAVQRATLVCKASQLILGPESVVTKQNPQYEAEQHQSWSTTCWLPTTCFIKPKNTIELQIALKITTAFQSKFAIRSGGHNANPGFSSVDSSGVVLDLRELRSVVLQPEKDVASMGPGAVWAEVYEQLEKDGLTVVGGRVSEVGVGGLILGGGMSHFSNHWGLACDSVKNFEVVLANSKVVNANANENPDIFRALKGGGPNFGIVTRFDLYTNPDYKVWYTFKMYSPNDTAQVMKATIEVQKAMESDDRIGFFLTSTAGFFVAGMLHLGWVENAPEAFKAFEDITPMMIAVPETNGTAKSCAAASSVPGDAKHEIGTSVVLPDADLYVELLSILQGIVKSAKTSESYSLVFTFQPIAKASVREGNSLNVLPVSQSWLAIAVTWTEDSEDELARKQIRELISGLDSAAKARGLHLDFQFMNDASYIQSPLRSYGAESLSSLSAVKEKWDPEGVFQGLQNGGFLLSKA